MTLEFRVDGSKVEHYIENSVNCSPVHYMDLEFNDMVLVNHVIHGYRACYVNQWNEMIDCELECKFYPDETSGIWLVDIDSDLGI